MAITGSAKIHAGHPETTYLRRNQNTTIGEKYLCGNIFLQNVPWKVVARQVFEFYSLILISSISVFFHLRWFGCL